MTPRALETTSTSKSNCFPRILLRQLRKLGTTRASTSACNPTTTTAITSWLRSLMITSHGRRSTWVHSKSDANTWLLKLLLITTEAARDLDRSCRGHGRINKFMVWHMPGQNSVTTISFCHGCTILQSKASSDSCYKSRN